MEIPDNANIGAGERGGRLDATVGITGAEMGGAGVDG